MKYPVIIFYSITTALLGAILALQGSAAMPYLEVLYIVFIFAESYFVLQNYNFDHGLPLIATFIKLVNSITILVMPIFTLIVHILVNTYIYMHIRGLDRRHKRLKYEYTVNNVIPGPFLLKIFASFLSPILFLVIIVLTNFRIRDKFNRVKRSDLFKYLVIIDVVVFMMMLTPAHQIAFLVYMITLIIFEFIPIENKL